MSRVQVSAGHQQANEAASQQRKRKARAPKARTPEPKEIITGAGQPLDLGLRRELEERLGHDFSRVRVHTDRDAALLTDLLGADAVTVGEDVFFAEGRFRPGTEDGRRLVAHELLHTVQAPHPLGALKAGRDLGAVSMPQDAVERQAEDGARSESPRPEVTRNATPGWLRYARVRADQFRTELLDPATLVDRLTAGILRSLRGDPTDATGRVRQQLTRFAPELKASVLERLSLRLPSSDHERLLELVERSERGPAETDAGAVPGPVTEPTHEPVEESDVPPKDPAGEKDEDDEGKDEPKPEEEEEGKEKGKEKGKGKGKEEKEKEKEKSEEEAEEEPPAKDKESKPEPGQTGPAGIGRPQEAPVGAAAGAVGSAEAPTATAAAQAPGAPEPQRMAGQQRPAEGSRPKTVDRRQDQQPGPARPEQVDKLANAQDSPLARHGLLDDEQGTAEDEPPGVEAEAEKDVETPKDEEPEAAKPAGPELRPEDFVPSTDLDVSSVPTADRLDISAGGPAAQEAPSFPEPPSTKADEIQQDRENEAEEEPEEAPEPPAPRQAEADRPAPAPEADASARREADREAESRTARDLQPDKPVEQEVGPDPEAGRPEAGRLGPETDQEAAPEPSYSDGPGRQNVEPAADEAPSADVRGRSERGPVRARAGQSPRTPPERPAPWRRPRSPAPDSVPWVPPRSRPRRPAPWVPPVRRRVRMPPWRRAVAPAPAPRSPPPRRPVAVRAAVAAVVARAARRRRRRNLHLPTSPARTPRAPSPRPAPCRPTRWCPRSTASTGRWTAPSASSTPPWRPTLPPRNALRVPRARSPVRRRRRHPPSRSPNASSGKALRAARSRRRPTERRSGDGTRRPTCPAPTSRMTRRTR
ncbi:eCIS core domain-containing protein [Streptomyces netropsis]